MTENGYADAGPEAALGDQESIRNLSLYREENRFENGKVILSARLESDRGEPQKIWFELPEEYFHMTTGSCDPFVLAVLFRAMSQKSRLQVHGELSSMLVQNLAEFQAVWRCWFPLKYEPVDIFADQYSGIAATGQPRSIAAFSGGIDSTFTVWRCTIGGDRRRAAKLEAGLFVHGFDIPLEQEEQFSRAADVAERTLKSAGIELIRMRCNLFDPDWEMTHGAAVAACLTLLKGHFSEGLIAGTFSYHNLVFPWGSNPITDPMLSGHDFAILHDSADTRRDDKEIALCQWKEGFNNLRVCYEAQDRDENCCRCAKCLMLFFSLKARGLSLPESFQKDMNAERALDLRNMNSGFASAFSRMVGVYEKRGLGKEPWFAPLKRCARYNNRRLQLERAAGSPFRDWLRQLQLRCHTKMGP